MFCILLCSKAAVDVLCETCQCCRTPFMTVQAPCRWKICRSGRRNWQGQCEHHICSWDSAWWQRAMACVPVHHTSFATMALIMQHCWSCLGWWESTLLFFGSTVQILQIRFELKVISVLNVSHLKLKQAPCSPDVCLVCQLWVYQSCHFWWVDYSAWFIDD